MIGAIIGALAQGAAFGAGAGAGDRWVQNHTGPAVTVPYWQGQIGDTTLALMVRRYHTQISYLLYVIAAGQSHFAGSWADYPLALARTQQWETYLRAGGSLAAWHHHEALRQQQRVIDA